MTSSEFEQVLAAAREGQAWACARLYEDLHRPVLGYVRLRGAAEPDDVTSETFLHVFRDLDGFEGDEASFRAWVFTIAHHRVLDAWRKRSRRPRQTPLTPTAESAGGDVEDEAIAALGSSEVVELLEVLTPEQRDVVLLRIVADLPVAEVAAVLDRSVGSVKALQHRAMNRLRRALNEQPVTTKGWRAVWGAR